MISKQKINEMLVIPIQFIHICVPWHEIGYYQITEIYGLINVLKTNKDVFEDSSIVDTIIGKVVYVKFVIWTLKHFGYKWWWQTSQDNSLNLNILIFSSMNMNSDPKFLHQIVVKRSIQHLKVSFPIFTT
jgi:hypothetical protein